MVQGNTSLTEMDTEEEEEEEEEEHEGIESKRNMKTMDPACY